MATFGEIINSTALTAGQSVRRNSGDTAFEGFTPGDVTASSTTTFTNKSGNISQWTNDSGYTTNTGTVTADSTDTFTNKSGNISMWTNDSGYTTNTGTVTPSSTDTFTNKTFDANGTGNSISNIEEADLTLSDITTNDATTLKHGFLPKLGGGTTNFLRADGIWSEPAGGSPSDISCRIYQSTTQSVTATLTAIQFNEESFDTDTMHDNSTNNTRITFNTAGKYLIGGILNTDANAASYCGIRLNGSTYIFKGGVGNAAINTANGVTISTIYSFSDGDYIELMGAFGTTNNTKTGIDGTNLFAKKI